MNVLDVASPTSHIDIGIAKGSCLIPLRLIFYINDNATGSIHLHYQIYVNDTTHYISAVDIRFCISILNECFSNVYRSLFIDKLSHDVSKTNYIIFHRRKKSIETICLTIFE